MKGPEGPRVGVFALARVGLGRTKTEPRTNPGLCHAVRLGGIGGGVKYEQAIVVSCTNRDALRVILVTEQESSRRFGPMSQNAKQILKEIIEQQRVESWPEISLGSGLIANR